jgi:ATP-dependent helicase HepA
MNSWFPGQRVLPVNEPELGLGRIRRVVPAQAIEVEFPGAKLIRRYALRNPPLRRFTLGEGARARHRDGHIFRVEGVREEQGLLVYLSGGVEVPEAELHHEIEDRGAWEAWIAGHWSRPSAYPLRKLAWELRTAGRDPDVRGLVGPRVEPLPHQLSIAFDVARREYPRVLLADEVGLGKTIEAGLIFSSLRALGRANRVLIIVPESLKHQWLHEMFRRFSETFAVLDEERDLDERGGESEEEDEGTSPFESLNKILTSWEYLLGDDLRVAEAAAVDWDLIIVDEAHHLKGCPSNPTPEWEACQDIASSARGLLLLTASPHLQGDETHFGLLHLVDPQRFPSLEEFREEREGWGGSSRLAQKLRDGAFSAADAQEGQKLFPQDAALQKLLQESVGAAAGELAPKAALNALVDRHGPGRVLFRNRRERLRGFPERQLLSVPLERANGTGAGGRPPDTKRIWLKEFLSGLNGDKALVLCRDAATVRALGTWLETEWGPRRALFHEKLDLLERDRQAAWFAEPKGAPVLVSSEIGGEGRNFQFARYLVLYDLPESPELLEQRIGRLDRIGRTRPVEIQVPWLVGTSEEVWFRWYHEGLGSFESTWTAGLPVLDAVGPALHACVAAFDAGTESGKKLAAQRKDLDALVTETRMAKEKLLDVHRASIDVLVDMNSFDETRGRRLRERVLAADRSQPLRDFAMRSFEHFGLENEELGEDGDLVKVCANSMMFIESFPELPPDEEQTIAFRRPTALAREELIFLTQDHPMVEGLLSLILEKGEGRAVTGVHPTLRAPVFEFLFRLAVTAPAALEIERFLPGAVYEFRCDAQGAPVGEPADMDKIRPLPAERVPQLTGILKEPLGRLVEKASAEARRFLEPRLAAARESAARYWQSEVDRLTALRAVNPAVRPQEIERRQARARECQAIFDAAECQLDAIRVLIPARSL